MTGNLQKNRTSFIIEVVKGGNVQEEAYTDCAKGIMVNSGMLDGLTVDEAKKKIIDWLTSEGKGHSKVNYKLRDWVFSRQRYWGEPFPVYYDANGMPQMLPFEALPLQLPEVDKFLPTATGEPPLGHATKWAWDSVNKEVVETSKIDNKTIFPLELCTMPGFAGSSAYYLRYMDPHNDKGLVDKQVNDY